MLYSTFLNVILTRSIVIVKSREKNVYDNINYNNSGDNEKHEKHTARKNKSKSLKNKNKLENVHKYI